MLSLVQILKESKGMTKDVWLICIDISMVILKTHDLISSSSHQSCNVIEAGVSIPLSQLVNHRLGEPKVLFSPKEEIKLIHQLTLKVMKKTTAMVVIRPLNASQSSPNLLKLFEKVAKGVLVQRFAFILEVFDGV